MTESGDTQNALKQQETPRKWFASIPNIVEEMNLNPYEYRLYAHFKKVVGEVAAGVCWKSTKTLAKECRMSAGSVSKAKKTLVEKGLIIIKYIPNSGHDSHDITIVDIWKQNYERYLELKAPKEDQRSSSERQRSPGETKKNPIRKENTEDSDESSPAPKKRTRRKSELDVLKSELVTHFTEKSGLPRPRCNTHSQNLAAARLWWQPLLRIAECVDKDVARAQCLVEWALCHADAEGLTIKAPKSIEGIATGEQARRVRTNGRPRAPGDNQPQSPMSANMEFFRRMIQEGE
jgi:hypothetical protein